MDELIQELMERDDLTHGEAIGQIAEFKQMFLNGELGYDVEEAFMEEFELEPDFIMDIF